jgi:alcohol oxidase
MAVLRLAYKKVRELLSSNPVFPEGSAAACSDSPIDISAPDLIYTPEDDKAIDKFHRNTGM